MTTTPNKRMKFEINENLTYDQAITSPQVFAEIMCDNTNFTDEGRISNCLLCTKPTKLKYINYSNIKAHLVRSHSDLQLREAFTINKNEYLNNVVKSIAKTHTIHDVELGTNIFGWIKLIVFNNQPFNVSENKIMLDSVKLS